MLLKYLLLTFSLAACQGNTEAQPVLEPDCQMIANVKAGPQTLGVAYMKVLYEDGLSFEFDTGGDGSRKQNQFAIGNIPDETDPVFTGTADNISIFLFFSAASNDANDLATAEYIRFRIVNKRFVDAFVCDWEFSKQENPYLFQPDKYGTDISRSRISLRMQDMFKSGEPIEGTSCRPMKSRIKEDNVF